jgi:hypothetical protein
VRQGVQLTVGLHNRCGFVGVAFYGSIFVLKQVGQ